MKSAIPLTLLLAVASAYGQQQSDTYGENLGTVHFPCSCSAAAVPQIERGVALLHHMTYEGAEAAFAAATKTDPGCAMGYWGMAMTHIHPLWPDVPSAAQMEKGMELIAEAKAQKQITAREHAYITALESYYKHGPNQDEKVRLAHFDAGWKKVHEQFPDDLEAASFYALAHMATATPEDKTYAKQKRAGALAERVLTLIPEHPGAHHYIIYAYLQKANDQLVKQAVESMLALEGPIHAHGAAAHTLAAVPVRYALDGVTPGEVLPARELLADLLLELGEPDAALIEYEATLKRSPNRWNSLYGAGRAAELAGYKAKAVSFYRQLVGEQAQGVPVRERLRHAKALLASE
jgi:tetratricopeptide (TPR) repeat protein